MPVNNTQAYVLDKNMQLVPYGVVGELYIGGIGLARDYIANKQLSNEKFIANPFDENGASRLYKTGDLVRWLLTDKLEYIGRTDEQVNIRGYRVEINEVKACLLAYPFIQDVVVVAREDVKPSFYLTAYIVMKKSKKFNKDDMLKHCHNILPDYLAG